MIVWLWIGGGVMALGTILALAPRLRRRPRAEPRRRRRPRPSPIPTTVRAPTDEPLEEVPA